jgi:hypothetical protein
MVTCLAVALLLGISATASARTTFLASTGPAGGNGANSATFVGASFDGSRLFFETSESLVAADADSQVDVYERRGGITTLVSVSDTAGNGPHDARFVAKSLDGTHVFFETNEALVAADSDGGFKDVYERFDGVTTLVSVGGSGAFDATRAGGPLGGVTPPVSDDGTKFYFETREALTGDDVESGDNVDVYERSGGATTLVSKGAGAGSTAFDAQFDGVSTSGHRVFFHTNEQLAANDTDAVQDIYERSGGGTTLVSTGPAGGNGAFPATFNEPDATLPNPLPSTPLAPAVQGAISSDGNYAFFQSAEALDSSDTDAGQDVYRRSLAGAPQTLKVSPLSGSFHAFFKGASLDGHRAAWVTREPQVGPCVSNSPSPDGDGNRYDFYGFDDSLGCALLSAGTANAPIDVDVNSVAAADGGTPYFFQTREALTADDTDSQLDVYQGSGGPPVLASKGPTGGNGLFDAALANGRNDSDITANGMNVFFVTAERLTFEDADNALDIYERDVASSTASLMSIGGLDIAPTFGAIARNGSRAYFMTTEVLTAEDTDGSQDVYSADAAVDGASDPAVPPDGSVSTNTETTPSDPVGTQVTTPTGGAVTITEQLVSGAPSGYTGLGWQVDISAPPASDPSDPLVLRFRADASLLPADFSTVEVFKDGVLVPDCASPGSGVADPDPCVDSRTLLPGGDGELSILTTSASDWAFGIENGAITIVKDARPEGPQAFAFVAGGQLPPETFQLDDDGDDSNALSSTRTFSNLRAGNGYSVTEPVPSGWRGTASCDDGSAPSNIDVAPGETVTCTFANRLAYPRPGGGTPLRVPLVPEFAPCTEPDSTHVAPLDGPSCSSPQLESSELTMGRFGAGHGFARLDVLAGNPATAEDEADIAATVSARDVRNASGDDYTGQVLLSTDIRVTDSANGPDATESATAEDTELSAPFDCVANPSASVGSACTISTTVDTLVPGFAREGDRTIISTLSLKVEDLGTNGQIGAGPLGCPPTCGDGDERVFLRQGVFAP